MHGWEIKDVGVFFSWKYPNYDLIYCLFFSSKFSTINDTNPGIHCELWTKFSSKHAGVKQANFTVCSLSAALECICFKCSSMVVVRPTHRHTLHKSIVYLIDYVDTSHQPYGLIRNVLILQLKYSTYFHKRF